MAQNEITKVLSDRLEELTEKKRDVDYSFSDKKQAEQMGIPYPTFVKYKGDKAECPISAIVKMAEYYGVSTEYLLGRTPDKTTNPKLKGACEYIGLHEDTIEIIKSKSKSVKQFISIVCESNEFWMIVSFLEVYYYACKGFIADSGENISEIDKAQNTIAKDIAAFRATKNFYALLEFLEGLAAEQEENNERS